MPRGDTDTTTHSSSFRLGLIAAGVLSSVSAIVLFTVRDRIKNGLLSRLLSFLDRDWIRNQLRRLSSSSSSDMIPSATTIMQLRCGLLCTSDEFPLLGTTESLLAKLGFELVRGDDDGGDDDGGGGRQRSPLVAIVQPFEKTQAVDIKSSEQLLDCLLLALDDLRDLRHRVEEEEEQNGKDGKSVSRKTKRMNYKVDILEKQRAKLLEKNQKRNDTEDIDDSDDEVLRDAWIRLARTYNSARLLLFLFSEEKGLDILSGYGDDADDIGIKGLNKTIYKLSDALGVLSTSSTSLAKDIAEGKDDDSFGVTINTLNVWEKFISEAIRSRRKSVSLENDSSEEEIDVNLADVKIDDNGGIVIDPVNDSVIELTDDDDGSSSSSVNTNSVNELNDQLDQINFESCDGQVNKSTTDVVDTPENTPNEDKIIDQINCESFDGQVDEITTDVVDSPGNTPNQDKYKDCISARCLSWNSLLDKLMKDLVSTMSTKSRGNVTALVVQNFDTMSLSDEVMQERAKKLDEQFSLKVGITGSTEYQKRKEYLFSIEKLRYRVEQRIRQGKKNHELSDARLEVYGSCLSGLSLGKNADVDLSLTFSDAIEKKMDFEAGDLTAKKYNRHVTDTVYKIKRKLDSSRQQGGKPEFHGLEAVPRARVPVIKGVYSHADNPHSEDGSLHFDICLLNDIAVANSGLIKEYSDIDIRVKSLMVAVKQWTKDNKINSAQDNTLSSYTWMNMVIFYLQCIGFVPNLQCQNLMRECNHDMGWGRSERRQDNINNLNTAYLKWKGQAEQFWKRSSEVDDAYVSVSILLYGFFRFYSREFPTHLYLVSIKRGGRIRLPKTVFSDRASLHLCIEDPFETYDSHFPHDLGTPADEAGSIFISRCFRDSSEHLRRILLGDDANEEDGENNSENEIEELWPILSTPAKNNSGRSRRSRNQKAEKRDPTMTLVIDIKGEDNNDDNRMEGLLKLFRPFADQTGSRVVGSALSKGGRIAYIDYDSVEASQAALKAHERSNLKWNGRALRITQKSRAKTSKNEQTTTTRNQKKDKAKNAPSSDSGKTDTPKKAGPSGEPEKTLVVKNISGKNPPLNKIFLVFAQRTQSRLIHIDLVKKNTKAFIEYDSSAAVKAALKEHSKRPMEWNGKILDIAQKQPNGWKKQQQQKVEGERQTETPSKGRGGRNQGRKKRQGNGNNNSKPIVNGNESIQGQLQNKVLFSDSPE